MKFNKTFITSILVFIILIIGIEARANNQSEEVKSLISDFAISKLKCDRQNGTFEEVSGACSQSLLVAYDLNQKNWCHDEGARLTEWHSCSQQGGFSMFSLDHFLIVLIVVVVVFVLKRIYGGSSQDSSWKAFNEAGGLKVLFDWSAWRKYKEIQSKNSGAQERANATYEAHLKEMALRKNPGMSEAGYNAMRAAELAKKDAELEAKARDIQHWEDVAAGKIPAGTPSPSEAAFAALPIEVRTQIEIAKKAQDDARARALDHDYEIRRHNDRVQDVTNQLRNAEIFKTGQEEYLRQELAKLMAKKF